MHPCLEHDWAIPFIEELKIVAGVVLARRGVVLVGSHPGGSCPVGSFPGGESSGWELSSRELS